MKMLNHNHTFLFYDEANEVGYITYSENKDEIVLEHVVVHDQYHGKGYASTMMEILISHLKKQQISFSCTCSYAISWVGKHH